MPEMHVVVRWPDGSLMSCYSPSLIVRDYLQAGTEYRMLDFLDRSRAALALASERVREKFGAPCVRAARQLAEIEAKAQTFEATATVRVESYAE